MRAIKQFWKLERQLFMLIWCTQTL